MSEVPSSSQIIFPEDESLRFKVLCTERFFKLPPSIEPKTLLEGDANAQYNEILTKMARIFKQATTVKEIGSSDQFTLRAFEPNEEGVKDYHRNITKIREILAELPEKLYSVTGLLYSIYHALGNEFVDPKDSNMWKLMVAEWGRREIDHIYVSECEMDATLNWRYPLLWDGTYIIMLWNNMLAAIPPERRNTTYLPMPKWDKHKKKFVFVAIPHPHTKVTPQTHRDAYFENKCNTIKLKVPAFKSADARLEAYMQISQK